MRWSRCEYTLIEVMRTNSYQIMASHLKSKEAAVLQGADLYHVNGKGCLERIDQRFDKERQGMTGRFKKDSRQFCQKMTTLMQMVSEKATEREEALKQFSKGTTERRKLYTQALTKLRSLQQNM